MWWILLAIALQTIVFILHLGFIEDPSWSLLLSTLATASVITLPVPCLLRLTWRMKAWAFKPVSNLEKISFAQIGLKEILRRPWVVCPEPQTGSQMTFAEARELKRQLGQILAGQVVSLLLTCLGALLYWVATLF